VTITAFERLGSELAVLFVQAVAIDDEAARLD
jgi:hypothetical protein